MFAMCYSKWLIRSNVWFYKIVSFGIFWKQQRKIVDTTSVGKEKKEEIKVSCLTLVKNILIKYFPMYLLVMWKY